MKFLQNHVVHRLLQRQKLPMLVWLTEQACDQVIVGAHSKHAVTSIVRALRQQGVSCDGLHPNRSRRQRDKIFDAFDGNQIQVLVATHKFLINLPATRVSRLIFTDVPHEHDYIRMLTIRPRQTVTFVTDADLTTLYNIESIIERRLKDGYVPRRLPQVYRPSRTQRLRRSHKRRSTQIPEEDTYPVPIFPIQVAKGVRKAMRTSQAA